MLSKKKSKEALRKLFHRHLVVDINDLYKSLDTTSRMSVFRCLRSIEYRSSYTHAGRYYTLEDIPRFDSHGIWFHQGRGFSSFGTLRTTIIKIVNTSTCGMTHSQLHHLLRIRVQDTLLSLVQSEKIGRQQIQGKYLYISIDKELAGIQLSKYQDREKSPKPLPIATVIEVLVESIHSSQARICTSIVAERLAAQRLHITVDQVEQVFAQFGIDTQKKT